MAHTSCIIFNGSSIDSHNRKIVADVVAWLLWVPSALAIVTPLLSGVYAVVRHSTFDELRNPRR